MAAAAFRRSASWRAIGALDPSIPSIKRKRRSSRRPLIAAVATKSRSPRRSIEATARCSSALPGSPEARAPTCSTARRSIPSTASRSTASETRPGGTSCGSAGFDDLLGWLTGPTVRLLRRGSGGLGSRLGDWLGRRGGCRLGCRLGRRIMAVTVALAVMAMERGDHRCDGLPGDAHPGPGLLDYVAECARHARGAFEDRELANVRERFRGCANDLRHGLRDLLGNDRFLVLAEGRGTALDARGLRRGLGLYLDRTGRSLGREANFLRGGFSLANADVAAGCGESGLAVGFGVGRLADVYLELLFLLLSLQLGNASFLLNHGLARLGLGERTLLPGLLLGAVYLRLETGLLDLGAPDRLGDLTLSSLLPGDRGLVGNSAGDAGILLDRGLVRDGQILDVVRRAGDRLDLEAVDDKSEGLHLNRAALAHLLGELVLVADHLLDGHRAGNRPQVADENVLDLGLEFLGRAIQEAASGVGD